MTDESKKGGNSSQFTTLNIQSVDNHKISSKNKSIIFCTEMATRIRSKRAAKRMLFDAFIMGWIR